jgi:hypothetical protein
MKGEKIVCFIDAPAVLGSGGMDDRRGNLEREVALIVRSVEGAEGDMGCGVHQSRDEIVADVERVLSALIDADIRPEVCCVSVVLNGGVYVTYPDVCFFDFFFYPLNLFPPPLMTAVNFLDVVDVLCAVGI